MGSSLPTNKVARQEFIMQLADKGYISQERARDLMEFADVEGIYRSLDETGAKQDILNIVQDNAIVVAEPWEDHTIHLKVINDFRKSQRYSKLSEEIRERINLLAQQHQDYLIQEQEAAARLGGPLPPAAQEKGA